MDLTQHLLDAASRGRSSLNDLAFKDPWSARIFGITLTLSERGHFTLGEFQQALIKSIRAYEASNCIDSEQAYYSRWLEALIALLKDKGVMTDEALLAVEERVRVEQIERQSHPHQHSQTIPAPLRTFRANP